MRTVVNIGANLGSHLAAKLRGRLQKTRPLISHAIAEAWITTDGDYSAGSPDYSSTDGTSTADAKKVSFLMWGNSGDTAWIDDIKCYETKPSSHE